MQVFKLIKEYSRNIILTFNIIFSILILLSYLSNYISPVKLIAISFLGLIYPFLLLINFLFIIFWIFSKSKFILIPLFSILLGWNHLSNFIQINNASIKAKTDEKNIHVLSYNVRVFNLWKWSSKKNIANRTFNLIRKKKADIVCLQEFFSKKSLGNNAKDSLQKNAQLKYSHISYTSINNKIYHHGIATFSAYPIVSKGSVKLRENDNFCIYSDIQIGNDTLRVFNVHLESIHLGYDDYQLIENIDSKDTLDVKGLKNILHKLKRGFVKRSKQSELIAKYIAKSKYPVILCGDFNDTPSSYVYGQLTRKLVDSFCESGNGIGSTYINKYSIFRIDYILHSPQLSSKGYRKLNFNYSDHYPIECYIQLNK